MNVNSINSFGAARNAAAINTIMDLVEVSQGVAMAKSQSISLDGNRNRQDIRNQVEDDQKAIADQEKQTRKEKRRERRRKIFGWIFHPVRSATKKISEHHAKKKGKEPKQRKFHPLQTLNTLLHPRKLLENIGAKHIAKLAKKTGMKEVNKLTLTTTRMQKSMRYATNVVDVADKADAMITGIQVSKIGNEINKLQIDEQKWSNLATMSKQDSEHDEQQLSDMLKDNSSNAKAITNMLKAKSKASSTVVSNIAAHA